ncbi:glycosyltransferase [Methylocaldum sp. GT1BB]|jgi:glycosyltransferase involved in cell wall biosynthesis|uniref:glycosyltransferase n=1 Tax=Methylocaldum sp. GT1BB TaxID=3438963 RepID=UPI003DA17A3D
MPIFGQAQFLPTALASIRAQTSCFELAVMDATPNDSVQDVLDDYRDILSYHRHGPDRGQSAAIQEGWDNTCGEIVAWLCADDYYFPYTLNEVERIFVERPDIDVVYGDCVFVDQNGQFSGYFPEISEDISLIKRSCCISQPSCFARRTALEKAGPVNPDLHYIMDWDLWTRLYETGAKFYYMRKPLSAVRMYQETKTASGSKARYIEIFNHLRNNANLKHTMRSLVGFYYQDLLSKHASLRERIAFHGINLIRFIKSHLHRRSLPNGKTLYGLDSYSHQVQGECEIFLPWYKDAVPHELFIQCKGTANLDVCINGFPARVLSKTDKDFVYVVGDRDIVGNLIHIRLLTPDNSSWQLLALHLG